MRNALILSLVVLFLLLSRNAYAYFNVTYLNTTMILGTNSSTHIVEKFVIYVSNSSIDQYATDRAAINLTISDWRKALGTSTLVQHIIGPGSSVSNFSLLPGPLSSINNLGGIATITMRYDVSNVTSVQNIAPRKFAYTVNNNVFNFVHVSSGEQLPRNARLNIVIPIGSQIVALYPAPDYPLSNFVGSYTNATVFSWYAGEPLSTFSFSYIVTESLQTEVTNYFSSIYNSHTNIIYILIIVIILLSAFYIYKRVIQ